MDNKIFRTILLFLCLMLFPIALVWAEDADIEKTKRFFSGYVEMEQTFNPLIIDLYADEVMIKENQKEPSGEVYVATFTLDEYREFLKKKLPMAVMHGDTNTYSNVTYTKEGNRVRIKCSRYSNLQKSSNPLELLVGPDKSGDWKVYEEIFESPPQEKK